MLEFTTPPDGHNSPNVQLDVTNSKIFTIGRSPKCNIHFREEKTMSGVHCKVYSESDELFIEDMSTNGCLINDLKELKKGERHKLAEGDSVALGKKIGSQLEGPSFVFRSGEELLDETLPIPSEFTEPETKNLENKSETAAKADEEKEERPETSKSEAAKSDGAEEIAENLTCSICCDLIHDCIALQPCMHSFCGGCYSEWMERSNQCPDCRKNVERVAKNHLMNNVIAAYLKDHPDKKRSAEELQELDGKNKITKDMLEPPKKKKRIEEEEDDDEIGTEDDDEEDDPEIGSDESGSDSSYTEEENNDPLAHVTIGTTRTGGLAWRCRECPGNPGRGRFRCAQDQNHALCQCCVQPFPDRRLENNPNLAPTQCTVCQGLFCHQYWGCTRPGCTGCLEQFKNLKFGPNVLNKILMGNQHESQILVGFLARSGKDEKDLFTECLTKLDAGTFTLPHVNSADFICYNCGLKQFQQLAYQYRTAIPNHQLPGFVVRPDCHWGRECRTQRTRPHHAANFNHLCDQTKFDNN